MLEFLGETLFFIAMFVAGTYAVVSGWDYLTDRQARRLAVHKAPAAE